jgi:hypothetical protein
MELLECEGLIASPVIAPLKDEANQLLAIFVTLIRKGLDGP